MAARVCLECGAKEGDGTPGCLESFPPQHRWAEAPADPATASTTEERKASVIPSVYDEIRTERAAQNAKWGGPEHDDEHDGLDWLSYLLEHAAKMLSGAVRAERGDWPSNNPMHDRRWTFTVLVPPSGERNWRAYRKQLIRVAALAVAAVESSDRRAAQPPTAKEPQS